MADDDDDLGLDDLLDKIERNLETSKKKASSHSVFSDTGLDKIADKRSRLKEAKSSNFHLDSVIKEICNSDHSLDVPNPKPSSASGIDNIPSTRGHSVRSKTSSTSKPSEANDASCSSHLPAVSSKDSHKSLTSSIDATTPLSPVTSTTSKASKGGSFPQKRACDRLRCTSCDFQVLSYEDSSWSDGIDYMFLRNNFPNDTHLNTKLEQKEGVRAYACQCRWMSVSDKVELLSLPDLKLWVCSKHS